MTQSREVTPDRGPLAEPPSGPSLAAAILTFAVRHAPIITTLALVAPLAGVIASFFLPARYTATVSFFPERETRTGGLPADLSGAAAALGITIGQSQSRSPEFFGEVLTSRQLLRHELLDTFPDTRRQSDSAFATLIDILEIQGKTLPQRIDRGERKLRRSIGVGMGPRNTDLVNVSVSAPSPALAAELANRLVARLNEFYLDTRQQEARNRRQFIESQVAEARQSLSATEDTLREFYVRNRQWHDSPALTFREGELRRRVDLSQTLFLSLARDLETVRVEEANNTPAITVVDPATAPLKRSAPRPILIAGLALVLGVTVGVTIGLARDFRSLLTHAPEYDGLRAQLMAGRKASPRASGTRGQDTA